MNMQFLCHVCVKFKLLYKLGTLNFISSFYVMVIKGKLRTDIITFLPAKQRCPKLLGTTSNWMFVVITLVLL